MCTLLDTVGPCFVKGTFRKKLDMYLKYFQRYTLSKPSPPVDVIFAVQDLFEKLRPKMELYQTYEDACADIQTIEEQEIKAAKLKGKMNERALRGDPRIVLG